MPEFSGWYFVYFVLIWLVTSLGQTLTSVWALRQRDRSERRLSLDLAEAKRETLKAAGDLGNTKVKLARANQKLAEVGPSGCYMIYAVTTHDFEDDEDLELGGQNATVTIAFESRTLSLGQVQALADEIMGGDTAVLKQLESGGTE